MDRSVFCAESLVPNSLAANTALVKLQFDHEKVKTFETEGSINFVEVDNMVGKFSYCFYRYPGHTYCFCASAVFVWVIGSKNAHRFPPARFSNY